MSVENPEKKISLDKNSQARKMKPRKKHNLVDETNNQEGLTALNETIFTAATSPVLNDDEDEGSHLKRALINEGKCENDGPEIVKKKRRTEKNKHATSIVFNDYEDLKTDSLRKEELTEMLNEVDCGKLKKVKKVKSKKITSGVLKNDESNKGMKENRISGDDRQTSKKVYSDNTNSRVDDVSAMNPSIVYLISWKKNRSDWSFKKLRQIWLLKNMYDETKLSNKHFKILLKYMKELKGKAREETLAQAREIMEKNEEDEVVESQEALQKIRAEKIVKLLA